MNQIDILSQEIVTQIGTVKSNLATAISNKGVTTNNNDSFATMATNISNISAGGGAYNNGDIISISQTTQTNNFMNWINNTSANITYINQSQNYAFAVSNNIIYSINKLNGNILYIKDYSTAGYGDIKSILIDETNNCFYLIIATTSVVTVIKHNLINGNTLIAAKNSSSLISTWNYKDALLKSDKIILFGIENTTYKCVIYVNLNNLTMTTDTVNNGYTIRSIMFVYRWDDLMTTEGATRIYVGFNGSAWYLFFEYYSGGSIKVGYTGYLSTAYKYTVIYDDENNILYTYYSNKIYKFQMPNTTLGSLSYDWMSSISFTTALGNYLLYNVIANNTAYLLGGNGIIVQIIFTSNYAYTNAIKDYAFQMTQMNIYNKDYTCVLNVENTSLPTAIRSNNFTSVCKLV